MHPILEALLDDDIDRVLIYAGQTLPEGLRLLHEAVELGNHQVVEALLQTEHVRDLHRFDDWAHTPLSLAVRKRRPRLVMILLGHGANPNAIHESAPGYSALSWAVMNRDVQLVGVLYWMRELILCCADGCSSVHSTWPKSKLLIPATRMTSQSCSCSRIAVLAQCCD
jgi:ankyrin repeat protein